MVGFSCLYREPDIPSRIFSLLCTDDLCHVELVCRDWRDLVVNENLWRKKLKMKQSCWLSWRCLLGQIKWKSEDSFHLSSKHLFFDISAKLGPDNFTPVVLARIVEDNLEMAVSKATTLVEKAWIKKAQADFDILVSNATPGRYQIPHNVEVSKLVVFGPAAFPILVTDIGCVVMAGAHYGKGRVVVVAHEDLLMDLTLMRGAADWCGRSKDCAIVCDPTSKIWNGTTNSWVYTDAGRRCPTNSIFLPRDQVSIKIPVYLTQGHYEDHADHLMEYVKQGGGLIVGGHAWWWTYIRNNRVWPWNLDDFGVCSLLEHPGNMIINRVGIVFSSVTRNTQGHASTTRVPGLKFSLRYIMRWREKLPVEVTGPISDRFQSDYREEFYGFSDRLKNIECFKDLENHVQTLKCAWRNFYLK